MLIPPSVLMIVWGILTEKSIGQIFLAGVLPGLLLTAMFVAYISASALFRLRPRVVGGGDGNADRSSTPYWVIMLIAMTLIILIPKIATLLPGLIF